MAWPRDLFPPLKTTVVTWVIRPRQPQTHARVPGPSAAPALWGRGGGPLPRRVPKAGQPGQPTAPSQRKILSWKRTGAASPPGPSTASRSCREHLGEREGRRDTHLTGASISHALASSHLCPRRPHTDAAPFCRGEAAGKNHTLPGAHRVGEQAGVGTPRPRPEQLSKDHSAILTACAASDGILGI